MFLTDKKSVISKPTDKTLLKVTDFIVDKYTDLLNKCDVLVARYKGKIYVIKMDPKYKSRLFKLEYEVVTTDNRSSVKGRYVILWIKKSV